MSIPKSKGVLAWAFGLVAGLTAATVLISVANAQGHESLARGMTQGAAIAAVAIAALWLFSRRAGGVGRLATGSADERDELLATKASSDASVGMFVAAVGGIVGGMYGMTAMVVGAVVLWAGVLVWLGSYALRSRRA